MPTEQEKTAVFEALVENGLSFIERSASELPSEPRFSIAHFATGLELLLKARLFAEHWTLIATDPQGSPWSAITSGDGHTMQASGLCAAITSTTGTSLNHEKVVFEKVFRHRNQVLHFVPPRNLEAVEAEQCLAWYRLHQLLAIRWIDVYRDFGSRIREVERTLRRHRPYLQARYDANTTELTGLAITGAIHECPVCQFPSAEMEQPILAVVAFKCHVCGTDGHLAEFDCGHRLSLYDLPAECACGELQTRERLVELLDPSPKDALSGPDRPHCGECLESEPTIVDFEEGYLCVACGVRFESKFYGSCEYCNTNWLGYGLCRRAHRFVIHRGVHAGLGQRWNG